VIVVVARVMFFHLDPLGFGASEVNLASGLPGWLWHFQPGLATANRARCPLSAQPAVRTTLSDESSGTIKAHGLIGLPAC